MQATQTKCDINTYLAERNQSPRRDTWKAEGAAILEEIKRSCAAVDNAKRA